MFDAAARDSRTLVQGKPCLDLVQTCAMTGYLTRLHICCVTETDHDPQLRTYDLFIVGVKSVIRNLPRRPWDFYGGRVKRTLSLTGVVMW